MRFHFSSIVCEPCTAGHAAFDGAGAQTPSPVQGDGVDSVSPRTVPHAFPFYDYPFNADPGSIRTTNQSPVPSMAQSLAFTKNLYQLTHQGLVSLGDATRMDTPGSHVAGLIAVYTFDYAALYAALPGGDSWMHEEWHRAVMGRRNIASFDDVYTARPGSETISVSHVTDEDMRRLKKDHPAEMVRLAAAGMEAQTELNRAFMTDTFLYGTDPRRELFLLWSNTANNIFYLKTCAGKDADRITVQSNVLEGARPEKRDFIGLDCNGWTYDLFRPSEPYDARGSHPYGPGVDRYIKYSNGEDSLRGAVLNYLQYGETKRPSDLTRQEQDYLRSAYRWSWVGVLSPAMIGYSRLPGPDGSFWNAGAAHYLAPFGTAVDLRFFFKKNDWNITGVLHSYHNAGLHLPGLEVNVIRVPSKVFGSEIFWSAGLALWLQPQGLLFWARRKEAGGLLTGGVFIPVAQRFEWFVEADAKTNGWAAGIVYLERALEIRSGVSVRL